MSLQNSHQISDVKVMLVKGADGKGISNIEKTGEEGLTDIYTITYTDGTKTTFTVTNGASGGMSALILITALAGSDVSVISPSGRTLDVEQVSGSSTLWQCESTEYGIHAVTASLNGNEKHASVDVDACKIYEVSLSVPDGATVLPTDDIATWLACGGRTENYSTLAEVLADSTCLSALIADNNAVDYLVRSTTFAKSVALVPAMTDDTHPSGECFASDLVVNPYRAFDENNSTVWYASTGSVVNQYVGYKFPSSKRIGRVKGTAYINTSSSRTYTVKVQGSNDGFSSDIHDLTSPFTYSGTSSDTVNINQVITNIGNYESYRLLCTAVSDSTGTRYGFKELQFYSEDGLTDNATAMSYIGLNNYASNTLLADSTWCSAICNSAYFESVLNVKVPIMTSNTAPSGVASGSSIYSAGYDYYKAFDGNDNSAWIMSASDSNPYLRYAFPSANKCKRVDIKYRVITSAGYPLSANTLKIQDSSGTHDFEQFTIPATSGETDNSYTKTLLLSNDIDYEGYQLKFSGNAVSVSSGVLKSSIMIKEIQFYGRVDV